MERLPALGRSLSDLRKLCGLSIGACADKIGVSAARLHDAEAGGIDDALLVMLVGTEDPRKPEFLVWALECPDLAPSLRTLLIHALEQTQLFDPSLRARALVVLRRHASELRGEPVTLWAALRRFASMVPVVEADALLDFLGDDEAWTTLQVTLQGIVSIFSQETQETQETPAPSRLRERVRALAQERISPTRVRSAEDAALAFHLVKAAAALGDPEAPEFFARFEQLGRRGLTEEARTFLASLAARREERSV